jgi:hypothetical protein
MADLAKRTLDGAEQSALGTASDEQSKHRPHDDAEAVSKDGSAKPKG